MARSSTSWYLVLCALAVAAAGCTDRTARSTEVSSTAATTAASEPAASEPLVTAPADSTVPVAEPSPECVGALDGPATEQYRTDVTGAAPHLVSLDVYRREGATGCPVIVWVHGGGWRDGDKQGVAIDTKVAFAGSIGAVLVSVNYRLVDDSGDVMWPTNGDDVATAVAWVLHHADDLGVDPTRLVLMGHSAGAHLAAIVATNPALLEAAGASRSDVRCVVALDSAAFVLTDLARNSQLVVDAFGTDPEVLADASPTVQAAGHPEGLPDMLVVTRGTRARVAEATEFVEVVAAGGATAVLVDAAPYSHMEVNAELGEADDTIVTPPTLDFLASCVG